MPSPARDEQEHLQPMAAQFVGGVVRDRAVAGAGAGVDHRLGAAALHGVVQLERHVARAVDDLHISAMRLATLAGVRASVRRRPMAMMCSALSAA